MHQGEIVMKGYCTLCRSSASLADAVYCYTQDTPFFGGGSYPSTDDTVSIFSAMSTGHFKFHNLFVCNYSKLKILLKIIDFYVGKYASMNVIFKKKQKKPLLLKDFRVWLYQCWSVPVVKWLWNQVQTPVTLLCLILDENSWEKYEPSYPPSYGLNNTTAVLLQGQLWY